MNQEMLNEQKHVDTKEVSLEGFVVKETLAAYLLPGNRAAKRSFTLAELKNIQKRKRSASAARNRNF